MMFLVSPLCPTPHFYNMLGMHTTIGVDEAVLVVDWPMFVIGFLYFIGTISLRWYCNPDILWNLKLNWNT